MEQLPENNTGQDDSSAASPAISLGITLREARERLGLSVADVADQIKFAPRQIEALEAEDFQHLPEMAFVRGFVRSYARILQLDAQALLAVLPEINVVPMPIMPTAIGMPFPDARLSQRQNMIWLGAALLLAVLVVVFAVWHFTTPLEQANTAQVETPVSLPAEVQITSASTAPEAEVIASSVPAAAATLQNASGVPQTLAQPEKVSAFQTAPQTQAIKSVPQPGISPQIATLRLVFEEDSWVEIKDRNGKLLPSQVNPRGSELRLDGQAPFSLVIGKAAVVRLYYREKQVDLKPYTGINVARLTLE